MNAEKLPPLTDEELKLIAEHAAGATDWYALSSTLEGPAATRASLPLRLVSMAFVYLLREADHGRGRKHATDPYGLMLETAEGTFPPRPAEVKEPVLGLWRQAAEAINEPVVRARLLDLLYVAQGPRAHADGRAAAQALEVIARRPSWSELDRAQAMARALDIASELNDRSAAEQRGPRAVALADELLSSEHPGPPFIVLRALVSLRSALRPTDLHELIERAVDRFTSTDRHVDALELSVTVADDLVRARQLREQQLDVLETAADAVEGLLKAAALRRAADFAGAHALDVRAQALHLRLQGFSVEADFERVQAQAEIPRDLVEQDIETTAGSGADDLAMALRLIGQYGPPGGSLADIEAIVARQRAAHPLLDVFEHTLVEAGTSIPLFVAHNEDDRQAMAVGRHRALASEYFGALLVDPMLHRAGDHHDRPSHEELAGLWSTPLIGKQRGERFARALELFWDDQPDESAHLLAPRLESVLRDLAAVNGMLVRKTPKPGTYGGAVTLGPVMVHLRDTSDEDDWICHLQALLCEPLSLNLRNVIAHGLTPPVGSVHAALLLQAACWLLRVRLNASS